MSVTSVLVPSDAFFTSGFQQQSWSYETVSPTSATAAFAQLSSSSVSLTSSSLPAPTSTPPVPPAPAATFPSSSAQTSFPKSSVGNYAASASAAASISRAPCTSINLPSSLVSSSAAIDLTAIAAAAFFLSRRFSPREEKLRWHGENHLPRTTCKGPRSGLGRPMQSGRLADRVNCRSQAATLGPNGPPVPSTLPAIVLASRGRHGIAVPCGGPAQHGRTIPRSTCSRRTDLPPSGHFRRTASQRPPRPLRRSLPVAAR